jgi:hypothetical protein
VVIFRGIRFKEDLCIHPIKDKPIRTLIAEAEMTDELFMIQIILTVAVWNEDPAAIDGSCKNAVTVA